MTRRFQFSLKALLLGACVAGIILIPLVVDGGLFAWDVLTGVRMPRQDLLARLARLRGTGTRTAVMAFFAAGFAALFVVIRLFRLQRKQSKK